MTKYGGNFAQSGLSLRSYKYYIICVGKSPKFSTTKSALSPV